MINLPIAQLSVSLAQKTTVEQDLQKHIRHVVGINVREARMVPYTPAHTLSLRMVPVYIQATESFHRLVRMMSLSFLSKPA